MEVTGPITGVSPASGLRQPVTVQPHQDRTSFGKLVADQVRQGNAPQVEMEQAVQQLATGENSNVQDVVLSVVKADLSFRMLLEIRNRVIEAYQEIMRMQV